MKFPTCLILSLLATVPSYAQWNYPPTRTVDAADTYFGVTYRDPYRWLENLSDKDVRAWFKAQAALTDALMAKIRGRDALASEWMALDRLQPAKFDSFAYENGRLFYKKTLGGENVGRLFFRKGWDGAEKLLFDPDRYKAGVTTTIQNFAPSFDGRHLVMALSSGGAEWSELRILDVDGATLLPESTFPSYGPFGWTPDGKSFFYDAGNVTDLKSLDIELNRKTRVHRLGTPFAADIDFFSDERNPELGMEPKEMPYAYIDESYPDYILGFASTVQNEIRAFYAPVSEMDHAPVKWDVLCRTSDNLVRGMVFKGDCVYSVTHANAPRYRVIRTSVRHPDWKNAETVVPEARDSIQSIAKSRDFMFVVYSDGIVGRIVKYEFTSGKSSEVKLPASGTVDILCPDWRSNRCLVTIDSWTSPTTLYDLDGTTGAISKSIFNTDASYPGFEKLVTEEVEVPGHDGAMIPLSIIHLRGIPMDGSNCSILIGYGAYGISYTPFFNLRHSVALRGVVLAYAHPRGGGEKGEAWYKAGYKATKPNTWKDFISCAEYLVRKGYTSPRRLAGFARSAGGILISRAVTERPDLFAAVVCDVGDANAMRDEFTPNGPVNTPEYGTVKDPAECRALYEMDGVQHVRPGVRYPAVLGVAGWNDPRVSPWQPGKFVAALQNASKSGKPVLMQVNYDDGHSTEEKTVTFRNFAGQYAFMLWQTGHGDFQPAN